MRLKYKSFVMVLYVEMYGMLWFIFLFNNELIYWLLVEIARYFKMSLWWKKNFKSLRLSVAFTQNIDSLSQHLFITHSVWAHLCQCMVVSYALLSVHLSSLPRVYSGVHHWYNLKNWGDQVTFAVTSWCWQNVTSLVHLVADERSFKVPETGRWAHIDVKLLHLMK